MAALLQGCGAFTRPKLKPVIEDRISQHWGQTVGVLATTPERRVFLVKMPSNQFCAEPSADAADNVAYALSAVAQAATEGKLADAQIGVGESLATSVRQLFQRTQGIQLYRDGNFMLCAGYVNGAISKEQYLTEHAKLLEVAARLIEKEIEKRSQPTFDTQTLPTRTGVKVDLPALRDSRNRRAVAGDDETKSSEPEPEPMKPEAGS
jgi:hypothetical protein